VGIEVTAARMRASTSPLGLGMPSRWDENALKRGVVEKRTPSELEIGNEGMSFKKMKQNLKGIQWHKKR
jgi:hypothetical protein